MPQQRKAGFCRYCNAPLTITFVDLGMSPLANSYLTESHLTKAEPFYPLHVYVCERCFLVQLEEFESPQHIFSDYAYFSSYSDSWLEHARRYVQMVITGFGLTVKSQVVELASNDGYLLQYFQQQGIPVLGIEPAANVAAVAEKKGIPTLVEFFGQTLARRLVREGLRADLIVGNNVLAHVPDLNDFVGGMKVLLGSRGVITMEFPHLLRLIQENQFDTIYHEHFSYFSFMTVRKVFASHGLALFDVEEIPTHGGSLRIFARHDEDSSKPISDRIAKLVTVEEAAKLNCVETYQTFDEQVKQTKRNILQFFVAAKDEGKTIVGYGAPAKGNTLLNYCGIRCDFIDYTVDRSPEKQKRFLPGTHIPIRHPDAVKQTKPDYLFILPWNLKEEIMTQMAHIREWGGRFVTPIPEVRVYS
jgi:hypothetical protein